MKIPPQEATRGLRLTSMIDVVFLLLIFFLVATRFDEQEKLVSIRLAEILQAQPLASGPHEVVVNITRQGEFIINDRTLNEPGLIALLHQLAVANPGMQTIQIRADREVQFLYPLTVIGICKKEKIEYYCTVLQERT